MRVKKRQKLPESPEIIFRNKLNQEHRENPGMMIKMERMAQGRMTDYRLRYVHASLLDPRQLEICLKELWGGGSCLLRFVDETRQPLDEFGALWIHLMGYDDLDDRLEGAQFAANMAILAMTAEMNQKSMDSGMANLTILAGLAEKNRRNKSNSRMIDALKRSIESAPPDDGKVMHETMKLISEMRNQQHQQILKQRADVAQQLQTALAPIMAEMQAALQAQELECQMPAEPVSQEHQLFPPGDCSRPIVGLPLQRLKTHEILQGLGKSQDKKEDDQ